MIHIKKIFAIMMIIFLASCSTPHEKEEITIGAIIPLTGIFSENGESSLKGYQLAVKDINEIYGKKINLVVESYKSNNGMNAITAYKSLKRQNINLILGPNHSPSGLAVAPLACQENTLMISPSIGTKNFAPECDRIFNIWPADYKNSKHLGELVAQKYDKIAILGSTQAWEFEQAQAVKEGIESVGKKVIYNIITDNSGEGINTDITKIKDAQAIIFTNYGYMDLYAKKIREVGLTAKFYVIILDETRKNNAKGAFEDAVIISSFTPTDEFINHFKDNYGVTVDFQADTSYDALMILFQAMQETKSNDPNTLSSKLLTYKNIPRASGVLSFDDNGNTIKEPIFQTVKNNEIIKYEWSEI